MIHAAIRCLAGALNEFFSRTLDTAEDMVMVASLLGADGAVTPDVGNKIVLCIRRRRTAVPEHLFDSGGQFHRPKLSGRAPPDIPADRFPPS
ncbi:hypothetical protein E7V67_014695 [[Empedobacter] haloabium]|uniref:Uncharacterized protein n=1 Tax=[Empedobacter] haloabium TaxID=592317 RepID=A0ABZ1UE07_9BURK